tara:strand:- start:2 stop:493 length:492 start_codon:yes stop_codon:yes gene_type:complete
MATGAQDFPDLTPSSRTFVPGEIAKTEFTSLDGTKTYLRYGNKRTESTLTLDFTNLTDQEVAWILDHYRIVTQNWSTADEKTRWVVFDRERGLGGVKDHNYTNAEAPDKTNTSYKPSLLSHMITGSTGDDSLRWRYSSAPIVTSVMPGISNVECKFVACLDSP